MLALNLFLFLGVLVRQRRLHLLRTSRALLEFVHPSGGIHELLLTRVERMGEGADTHEIQRILFAVLPLGGKIGVRARAREELLTGCGIPENHVPVVLRMAVCLHKFRAGYHSLASGRYKG